MKRTPIRKRRPQPRRREAPRWTAAEWEAADVLLRIRSGMACECCGNPLGDRVERHHRQRRRDGGDRLSNIAYLRPLCHRFATEHPGWAIERGLIVPSHADPAETPILWHGTTWVRLDDVGGRIPA